MPRISQRCPAALACLGLAAALTRARVYTALVHSAAVRPAVTASTTHHGGATGWFLGLLIVVGLLYVGWRSGTLSRWGSDLRRIRLSGELKGVRIRPLALLPTLVLLIVVALLLIKP